MDEYKAWSKIKEQDRCCIFCGRMIVPYEADFSISKRKTVICWHKECLKRENRRNKQCLM